MTGAAPTLIDKLRSKQILICLGSGGVGKTTTAASLAIAMAGRGDRVVVLTIDPARRLADALGRGGSLGNDPVEVDLGTGPKPGRRGPGQVWAAMLDPAETFEQVIRSEAEDDARAQRILGNRLFTNLSTSLSGTNEYMAAERLHQLNGDDRFDRVIIDTPPSRHAFDFLDSPGRLTRFVDHRLYRSVFARKPRLLRPINAGTQMVMRLLGRLVGTTLVDDVVTFFADFEGLDEGFRRRADEIESLLTGPETGYILVTGPRRDRLAEAEWILGNLGRRQRHLDAVIVNRVMPIDLERAAEALSRSPTDAEQTALHQNLAELATLAQQEAVLIDSVSAMVGRELDQPEESVALVTLAEQLEPVRDLPGLSRLAELL